MCGINGICLLKDNWESDIKYRLDKMNHELEHRGPNDSGFFIYKKLQNQILGMGHRRLSIIDLETGHQPMYSADKSVVVVFNGEIYNFRELKEDLIKQGFNFETTSDTEVLIIGYQAYGLYKILDIMEGMFAFALYDILKDEFLLARDKFGEKPVYYSLTAEEFLFSSEMKAFEPNLKKIGRASWRGKV